MVDLLGTLTVLQDGECTLSQPAEAGESELGQPAEGSTLQLLFQDETDGQALDLSIQLSRGFPTETPEDPAEESPSPDMASPGAEETPPLFSGEQILPFTILPDQVEVTAQLPDLQSASPNLLTGSVAPNGVNGYLIMQDEDGALLTVNFVCAEAEDDAGMPDASPDASPGADESPAIEPSPSP